jgi:streptogramin lyase
MRYHRIPWADAFPSDVEVDRAGRLWFTDRLTHAVGVFDPAAESFQRIPTPTQQSAPYGMVTGPDGMLWFGESNGGRLGRLDPGTGEIIEVDVGLANGPQLLTWAGGALWFTSMRDDALGRYRPVPGGTDGPDGARRGDVRVWRVASPERRRGADDPYGIASTPDGRVWVGRQSGSILYRVDLLPNSAEVVDLRSLTDTVDFTEPAPIRLSQRDLERLPPELVERMRSRRMGVRMRRVAAGPDGRLWVAGHGRGRVVGIHPDTDAKRILATLDPRSQPYAVAVDPWGRVWYSEQGNDAVVVYDPTRDERRRLPLPLPGGTVRDIAFDAVRGRVWLPMSDIGAIAVIELGPAGSDGAPGSPVREE